MATTSLVENHDNEEDEEKEEVEEEDVEEGEEEIWYNCKYCTRVFPAKELALSHVDQVHNNNNNSHTTINDNILETDLLLSESESSEKSEEEEELEEGADEVNANVNEEGGGVEASENHDLSDSSYAQLEIQPVSTSECESDEPADNLPNLLISSSPVNSTSNSIATVSTSSSKEEILQEEEVDLGKVDNPDPACPDDNSSSKEEILQEVDLGKVSNPDPASPDDNSSSDARDLVELLPPSPSTTTSPLPLPLPIINKITDVDSDGQVQNFLDNFAQHVQRAAVASASARTDEVDIVENELYHEIEILIAENFQDPPPPPSTTATSIEICHSPSHGHPHQGEDDENHELSWSPLLKTAVPPPPPLTLTPLLPVPAPSSPQPPPALQMKIIESADHENFTCSAPTTASVFTTTATSTTTTDKNMLLTTTTHLDNNNYTTHARHHYQQQQPEQQPPQPQQFEIHKFDNNNSPFRPSSSSHPETAAATAATQQNTRSHHISYENHNNANCTGQQQQFVTTDSNGMVFVCFTGGSMFDEHSGSLPLPGLDAESISMCSNGKESVMSELLPPPLAPPSPPASPPPRLQDFNHEGITIDHEREFREQQLEIQTRQPNDSQPMSNANSISATTARIRDREDSPEIVFVSSTTPAIPPLRPTTQHPLFRTDKEEYEEQVGEIISQERFYCEFCDLSYPTRKGLALHTGRVHKEGGGRPPPPSLTTSSSSRTTGTDKKQKQKRGDYYCKLCDSGFASSATLLKHQETSRIHRSNLLLAAGAAAAAAEAAADSSTSDQSLSQSLSLSLVNKEGVGTVGLLPSLLASSTPTNLKVQVQDQNIATTTTTINHAHHLDFESQPLSEAAPHPQVTNHHHRHQEIEDDDDEIQVIEIDIETTTEDEGPGGASLRRDANFTKPTTKPKKGRPSKPRAPRFKTPVVPPPSGPKAMKGANITNGISNDSYCHICQLQFVHRARLKQHLKTLKHEMNEKQLIRDRDRQAEFCRDNEASSSPTSTTPNLIMSSPSSDPEFHKSMAIDQYEEGEEVEEEEEEEEEEDFGGSSSYAQSYSSSSASEFLHESIINFQSEEGSEQQEEEEEEEDPEQESYEHVLRFSTSTLTKGQVKYFSTMDHSPKDAFVSPSKDSTKEPDLPDADHARSPSPGTPSVFAELEQEQLQQGCSEVLCNSGSSSTGTEVVTSTSSIKEPQEQEQDQGEEPSTHVVLSGSIDSPEECEEPVKEMNTPQREVSPEQITSQQPEPQPERPAVSLELAKLPRVILRRVNITETLGPSSSTSSAAAVAKAGLEAKHEKIINDQGTYCHTCKINFRNSYSLRRHTRSQMHLGALQGKKLKVVKPCKVTYDQVQGTYCHTCKINYRTNYSLRRHTHSLMHREKLQGKKLKVVRPYKGSYDQGTHCHTCNINYRTNYNLRRHTRTQMHRDALQGKPPMVKVDLSKQNDQAKAVLVNTKKNQLIRRRSSSQGEGEPSSAITATAAKRTKSNNRSPDEDSETSRSSSGSGSYTGTGSSSSGSGSGSDTGSDSDSYDDGTDNSSDSGETDNYDSEEEETKLMVGMINLKLDGG